MRSVCISDEMPDASSLPRNNAVTVAVLITQMSLLLPTDLSEASFKAFPIAIKYAKALNLKIVLCSFVEPAPDAAWWMFTEPSILDATPINQDKVIATLKQGLERTAIASFKESGVEYECFVEESQVSIADAVCDKAKQMDAELIVIATHGRRGLAHMVLGSVTERVVRLATCPVLTVPAK